MIDFKEISHTDGEVWELFTRDFLKELGFFVESPPDRGSDGGKDLLVTEQLQGKLTNYRMRWLVSCKHFAQSGNAVSEIQHEHNIRERMDTFQADGFMGVYSTIASAGLNTRLSALKKNSKIDDFIIFDHRFIENHLITAGYSHLLMRYFPKSYTKIRPLHPILGEYFPLCCNSCGKDLLLDLYEQEFKGLIAFVKSYNSETQMTTIQDVYFACKGNCDRGLRSKMTQSSLSTSWEDISDIATPIGFINWIVSLINIIHLGRQTFSPKALDKVKNSIIAISQKVLREGTERERKRFIELQSLGL